MRTSCIRHPENNRYIQLHEWQLNFCQENHCAALLLAFFIAWHDWKIRNDQYYRRVNDIAEMHGDDRLPNENAYLFFSMDDLVKGCMQFYGKKAINEALDLLESLQVISIHTNPNPRYHFDKTKYFQLYPSICNRWISENYPIDDHSNDAQAIESIDHVKVANRNDQSARRASENALPSGEKARYITNTTNNTTNKNQSINTQKYFIGQNKKTHVWNEEKKAIVEPIIDVLIEQGFSEKHFEHPDTIETIQRLCTAGATTAVFLEAYEISAKTSTRGFGVNYLAKVVEDLLVKKRKNNSVSHTNTSPDKIKPEFKSDYSKGLDWMGDLV